MTIGSIHSNVSGVHSFPELGEAVLQRSYSKVWSGKDGKHNWCNDYVMSKTTDNIAPCILSVSSGTEGWREFSVFTQEAPVLSGLYIVTDQDELELYNKLGEQARGHVFDPALAFAELDKTSKMLGDTAHDLAEALGLILRGKYRQGIGRMLDRNWSAPRHLKKVAFSNVSIDRKSKVPHQIPSSSAVISNKMLEFQFGWNPLISDIQDAAEAYAAATHYFNRVHLKATSSKHWTTEVAHGGKFGKWSGRVESSYVMFLDNPIPLANLKDKTHGTQINNLLVQAARIGWERTYLSFVVDWFLGVGDSLTAMQTLLAYGGLVMRTDILSERSWIDSHWVDPDLFGVGLYKGLYTLQGSVERRNFTFRRKQKQWSIFGIVTDYLNSLDTRFSPTHMIEGLGVLRQMAGGGRKRLDRF